VNRDALQTLLQNREPGLMDATGRYAVLVPLAQGPKGPSLLYEVRAKTLRRQPGEVCFPGGRLEKGERPEQCALRELEEELAIPPAAVQVLGRLDFIAHRANFIMYPILGWVEDWGISWLSPSPAEVEETFFVPLSHLKQNPPLEYTYQLMPTPAENFPYDVIGIPQDYKWQPGGENVPVYPWEGRAIWGLTGRITRHLLQLLEEAGL
jgi:coenzyme A diphosphatase NUDT7